MEIFHAAMAPPGSTVFIDYSDDRWAYMSALGYNLISKAGVRCEMRRDLTGGLVPDKELRRLRARADG